MMILIAVFQALCRFILLFVKILLTAGIAFTGAIVLLALICELVGDDE